MKLISLELSDFRCFLGSHRIEFSHDPERRVTIFHGENGAGKTNLLNAIHWCFTGKFTPRFQDKQILVNKEASRQGRRECFVEIVLQDESERGSSSAIYRIRRSATNDRETGFEVFRVEKGNSTVVPAGQGLIHRFLPAGLVSWFFFDAEAIGSLELSGSEPFRQDLRKTLGFDLVDTLLADLEAVYTKRRQEVASQTNDKDLKEIQSRMDDIDRALPGLIEERDKHERKVSELSAELELVRAELAKKPKAEPLEKNRRSIEAEMAGFSREKLEYARRAAETVGRAAPATFLQTLVARLAGKLDEQEVRGRLPSPFSDQLVDDILKDHKCICGRDVNEGTEEEKRIRDLLKFASTGELNRRINAVRYLSKDVERFGREFPADIQSIRSKMASIDRSIGSREDRLKEITQELQGIDQDEIKKLEHRRIELEAARTSILMSLGAVKHQIENVEARKADLKVRYDLTVKRLAVNARLNKEMKKVQRLIAYITAAAKEQEKRALNVLSIELNSVLDRYLTKHYRAKIDPATYAVQLIDEDGKKVGHSTGEGQVLKFAFIATVVAMAAKKTQEKIEWLSVPTVAPLVLDAPFSALDPVYQGSVAKNLANQTTQLVLMISSAAWGESVEEALEPFVGKRYLIVSKEAGARGQKPIKTLHLKGRDYELNQYGAAHPESVFGEIA